MPAERIPPLQALIPMCAVIGFVIGALVPSWYRNASSVAVTDENGADADAGAQATTTAVTAKIEAAPPAATGDRVVALRTTAPGQPT